MDSAFLPMPSSHSVRSNPIGITPGGRALTQHEKLVEQTRKWVAVSFFEPMLKQMRKARFTASSSTAARAGKAFESMYDERLAERMASDATDTLVSSIVSKIEGSKAYARQSAGAGALKNAVNSEREGADRVRAISATGDANVSSHF